MKVLNQRKQKIINVFHARIEFFIDDNQGFFIQIPNDEIIDYSQLERIIVKIFGFKLMIFRDIY